MYKTVTNMTNGPIGLGLTVVLPDETVNVPVGYENSDVIRSMVKRGELKAEEVKVQVPVQGQQTIEGVMKSQEIDSKQDAEDKARAIAAIKKMKRSELEEMAKKSGVEIVDNDTVETLQAKLIDKVKSN